MMTEATVRPVFNRVRLETPPKFYIYIDAPDTDTSPTVTRTFRPPPGEVWTLNYVQILAVSLSGGTKTMCISLTDGTTEVYLDYKSNMNLYDTVSFGSFGNGPLLLTNNFYLKTVTTTNSGTGEIFHVLAGISVV